MFEINENKVLLFEHFAEKCSSQSDNGVDLFFVFSSSKHKTPLVQSLCHFHSCSFVCLFVFSLLLLRRTFTLRTEGKSLLSARTFVQLQKWELPQEFHFYCRRATAEIAVSESVV